MKTLLYFVLLLSALTASASPGQPYFVRNQLLSAPMSPALTNSLVYYWGMESTGDETNYVNGSTPTHGTFAATTNGVVSNAVVCPGSPGGSAAVPDTYWTNQDWTMCGWFKVTGWNNSDVILGNYEAGVNSWFIQEDSGSGQIKTMFFDKNNVATLWNTTTVVTNWHFWAMGYSPTSNVCWFQADGAYRYTATMAAALKFVGGQPFDSGAHFTGALDEVGIWSRTLTPSEVGWLFNDGHGRSFLDLKSNYYSNDYYSASMASEWTNRVAINGGALPSTNTTAAVAGFLGQLTSSSIYEKILSCCLFVPDNLTAAITPVIKVKGSDPWAQNNFVVGDLSTNGLKGNKINKYLDTGFAPTTGWSSDIDCGATLYVSEATTATGFLGSFGNTVPPGNFDGWDVGEGGSTQIYCHDGSTTKITVTATPWLDPGFFSYSRGAANSFWALYYCSTNSAATNNTATAVVPRNARPFFLYCLNADGTPNYFSDFRISFAALHSALTTNQTVQLYNAVQALRTSLGGGYR